MNRLVSMVAAALAVAAATEPASAQCGCARSGSGVRIQQANSYNVVTATSLRACSGTAAAMPATCCGASRTAMPAAIAALAGPLAVADDKPVGKTVKLTGTLVCAKCKLKMEGITKCTNALQVKEKEGDKPVTYLLEDKGNGETYHEELCGGGELKDVTVAGNLTEKDGKKWVKPTKVETKK